MDHKSTPYVGLVCFCVTNGQPEAAAAVRTSGATRQAAPPYIDNMSVTGMTNCDEGRVTLSRDLLLSTTTATTTWPTSAIS